MESHHELQVASDIILHQECLKDSPSHFGSPWLAVPCARNDKRFADVPRRSRRPSAYILTISGPIAGGGHTAKAKPGDIKLYSGAYLAHLRWSAWGAPTAHATGDELDVDKTTSPYRTLTNPVTVRAYSLRRCGAKRVYRRLSVRR